MPAIAYNGIMVTGSPIRDRRRTALALALCGVVAGCAPSLGSVKATAGLGAGLAAYQGAFDLAATYCRYASLGTTPDPQCHNLEVDAANWHAVNQALVGYATALNAMADDSKDQSQQTTIATSLGATAQIGVAWSAALDANVTAGVSQGVSTLIAGITGVYRRERLARTIRDSAEAVQAVVNGLDQNIQLLDRAEQNVAATIADTITSIQAGTSPAADRLGLAIALQGVQVELAAHRAILASYKAAADSFAKAHTTIKKGLSGLGERQADLELLKRISSDVSQIVKDSKTALTPITP
jgi:hypothetical protein